MTRTARIAATFGLAVAVVWLCGCGGGGGGGDGLTPTTPPPQPFNLAGTVKDTSGNPLLGAAVTATVRSTGTQVASTTSAATGKYGFFLPPADYTIRATLAGYQPGQVDVNLYAGDKKLSVDITLSK